MKSVLLVAEDDPDDRVLIEDALNRLPLEVDLRFVQDGNELMDYLQTMGAANPTPNLILLDLNLPGKDGQAALKEMQAHPDLSRIPVVILTTSNAESDILFSFEYGAKYFYRKPSSLVELADILGRLVTYFM